MLVGTEKTIKIIKDMKKEISKNKWRDFVKKNSCDSYSLVVCLAILILFEAKVKNREEAQKVLMGEELGLSGAQAEMAIGYALNHKVEGLPDEEMAEIRKT